MHQNSPFWYKNSKNFLGRGRSPLPTLHLQWGGGHPSYPHTLGAFGASTYAPLAPNPGDATAVGYSVSVHYMMLLSPSIAYIVHCDVHSSTSEWLVTYNTQLIDHATTLRRAWCRLTDRSVQCLSAIAAVFLLLARYVPNVAKRSIWHQFNE